MAKTPFLNEELNKEDHSNKKKRNKRIIIIILLILLIIFSIFAVYLIFEKNRNSQNLELSQNQMEASNPNLTNSVDDGYFELVGFGRLQLDENNQNLNLINPSENRVYLSFDVIYNDDVLYESDLIEPGKMEQYNAYGGLNAGEHTITYSINVYDIENKKPLWTGIKQKQEVIIKS